ncbi:MAG: DUF3570 domain-containing protein [Halioglobus sp.]|nr:DUF3570 domain-containing protein [Halioglobus sp.]
MLRPLCLIPLFLPLGLSLSGHATAGPSADELDNIFAFKGLVYRQEDDGGNPEVDEDASVYEGLVLVRHRLNETEAINLRLLGDVISAASYDEAADRAETVSGATGYNPGRFDIRPGWEYSRSGWSFGTHISYGQEFAYRSFGAGLRLGRSLFEGSTVLGLRLQGFSDKVRMIRFDGTKESDEDRDTIGVEFTVTQTLSPTRVLNASYSYTDQDGFLATSFNAVRVGDEQDFEILPRQREREALGLRFKQALGPHSVETAYRYYEDDWDINAHTLELTYFHWLATRA